MKLNQKHMRELSDLMSAGMSFHMTFWMQDDQDLGNGFRRREIQRRKRWAKAMRYFGKLTDKLERSK